MYINIKGRRINFNNVKYYSSSKNLILILYTNDEYERFTLKTEKEAQNVVKRLDNILEVIEI